MRRDWNALNRRIGDLIGVCDFLASRIAPAHGRTNGGRTLNHRNRVFVSRRASAHPARSHSSWLLRLALYSTPMEAPRAPCDQCHHHTRRFMHPGKSTILLMITIKTIFQVRFLSRLCCQLFPGESQSREVWVAVCDQIRFGGCMSTD